MSFSRALGFALRWEGGFVDHPADRGGPTNKGVTQATYDEYRYRSVALITDAEVEDIYRHMYWVPGRCDSLPERIGMCHFDACVNHGLENAARLLQRAVGVVPDGIVGPITLREALAKPEDGVIRRYLDEREDFYRRIVARDPSQGVFLRGWLNRAAALREELLS